MGGGLAIHAPMHAKGIHLRFLNSANELDSDVFKWGAGNAGHFELLCEPVDGWPKGKADTFTPRRGPQNQKRGATDSPDVCFEAWAKILPRWHISGHLKMLRIVSGNTVPTYQVPKPRNTHLPTPNAHPPTLGFAPRPPPPTTTQHPPLTDTDAHHTNEANPIVKKKLNASSLNLLLIEHPPSGGKILV